MLNLEKAQQQQKNNEETLKELENTVNDVNRDVETIQERRAALKAEIHLLESEKLDTQNEIKGKEKKAKERLIPFIEKVTQQIAEINGDIASIQIKIEKEELSNGEIDTKLISMEKEKEEQKDKIEALQQEYMKDRDEPVRIGKGNENLKKAVEHLKADLEKLQNETKAVDEEIEREKKAAEGFQKQKQEIIDQIQQEASIIHSFNMDKNDIAHQLMQHDGRIHNYNQNLHLINQNVEANTRSVRDTQDLIKKV